MEIEELKGVCQKFLNEHLGKNLKINEDSDDSVRQVYSTLHEWNLNENKKGEISFWCSNGGWKSEDETIKEEDVVCWLCLERYISVKKENMKDFVKTNYKPIYDDNCYEDKCIKEKKLFIQAYFTKGKGENIVYISYCFKNEKSNCDEEFFDFFKQLIDGNFISDEEIEELKKSIVGKFIKTNENVKENVDKNSYLQNIYDGFITSNQWNSAWFHAYKTAVEKFIDCGKKESWDDETLSLLVKNVSNGISSLKQKNFENADYAKIKTDWENIQPIVKQICESSGVDEKACKKLSDFLYQNSREKLHSAVHRVIAAFLPNKVSTIVKKKDFDIVSKRLSEKFKDYPPITNDWLKDNINFIEYCNKNVVFKHPWHSSLFAWHLKNFFEQEDKNQKEIDMKMDEIVKLLENNHNIILHGAPGTGKTYLAEKIARKMGCKDDQMGFVQFHQSYDYTDFVEGLKPLKKDNSSDVYFEKVDGVFKSFCEKALKNLRNANDDNVSKNKTLQTLLDDFIVQKEDSEDEFTLKKGDHFKISHSDNRYIYIDNGEKKQDVKIAKKDMARLLELDNIENVVEIKKIFNRTHRQKDSYMFSLYGEIKKLTGKQGKSNNPPIENTSGDKEPLKKYVFIIDEINRGEMSKIFGELFYAIDPGYRISWDDIVAVQKNESTKAFIRTQYANMDNDPNEWDDVLHITEENDYGHFFVPENVYIIGTMNDIDRSVESMDFAIRRRFAFKEITADDRIEMLDSLKCGKKNEAVKCMQALNKEIESISGLSSAYHIGPAYFLKLDNYEGRFEDLWKYHIEGVLREYLRGMPKAADHLKKLKECYDKSIASESSDSSGNASDSVENS
jgi:5-methylcytosine-specific restriction endonuclease McrBC GTP-binding regulatory subunit McrB